jgi:hypothetical protein
VDAKQVQDIMNKYVHTDKMSVVVVAPAGQAKEQLTSVGEVKVTPMPAKREEMLKPRNE